jgi:hypothetical protein
LIKEKFKKKKFDDKEILFQYSSFSRKAFVIAFIVLIEKQRREKLFAEKFTFELKNLKRITIEDVLNSC